MVMSGIRHDTSAQLCVLLCETIAFPKGPPKGGEKGMVCHWYITMATGKTAHLPSEVFTPKGSVQLDWCAFLVLDAGAQADVRLTVADLAGNHLCAHFGTTKNLAKSDQFDIRELKLEDVNGVVAMMTVHAASQMRWTSASAAKRESYFAGVQNMQRFARPLNLLLKCRASAVFPLSLSAPAAAKMLTTEVVATWTARVAGYTTSLTWEAGASSIRFQLCSKPALLGNVAVLLQSKSGWLPGLGNVKPLDGGRCGLEVVVLARPDLAFTALTYLGDATLQQLWPVETMLRVKVLSPAPLMKPLSDCPGQWLRDRLLHLCDRLNGTVASTASGAAENALRGALRAAGLRVEGAEETVAHADRGQRVSQEELGYWQEEADKGRRNIIGVQPGSAGHRCAGSMEGSQRRDVPDDIIASMLLGSCEFLPPDDAQALHIWKFLFPSRPPPKARSELKPIKEEAESEVLTPQKTEAVDADEEEEEEEEEEGEEEEEQEEDAVEEVPSGKDQELQERRAEENSGREAKEREAKEQEAKNREAKEREAKEREAKEREAKELEAREREAKEREAKEREAKEREAKEREAKAREAKEREGKEREAKEREAKEREAKERAKEREAKEAKEREAKEQEAKERGTKERGAKEMERAKDAHRRRSSQDSQMPPRQSYLRKSEARDRERLFPPRGSLRAPASFKPQGDSDDL
eukprot:s689_g45.t3